jgi:uncharacterized protein YgbK (DUF1537 family)
VIESPILVLADDLTGALETGAKFAGAGLASAVAAGAWPDAATPALVADTGTRRLSPADAFQTVRALVETAPARRPRLIYKKTDSTLRGNIGSELAAVAEVYGGPIVYAPAYPRLGRTVRGGCLYVDGVPVGETEFARDALNPVRESYVPRLVAGLDVQVVDGDCDEDLRAAARSLLARPGTPLAAGPAAFAEAIADQIEAPRTPASALPAVRSCLVINGSRHPAALAQVRHAGQQGWPLARADDIESPGWAILDMGSVEGEGIERARQVGRMVRGILRRAAFDALAVFGGDTAAGILEALGKPVLYPLSEIAPGVPLSRAAATPLWITKAGGFGPVDLLTELRIRLKG